MHNLHAVYYGWIGIIILLLLNHSAAAETTITATRSTTEWDRGIWLELFHMFREYLFNRLNQTGSNSATPPENSQQYLKTLEGEFPCERSRMRSKRIPDSVHRLRPGDIRVIAAIGDSLTVGSGATATTVPHLTLECRGLAWCIGGQWTWRNATTLPNILRAINPQLVGQSLGNALPIHADSQLNLAEIGAGSADMPAMTRAMIGRIRQDRRIDFRRDWKMVTTLIGGNDICSYICMMSDPESLPEQHRRNLVKSLRYMRDHLPRTFVNIVSAPLVKTVAYRPNKSPICSLLHVPECSCWMGRLYNQSESKRKQYHDIQLRMQAVEAEVASMEEFQHLDGFAVVYQPFSLELSLKTYDSDDDTSLLAYDCFHLSQKGHSWAGVSLWNNMLEPPGRKSKNWSAPQKRFLCPSDQFPYIYTNSNGNDVLQDLNRKRKPFFGRWIDMA